jgi:hypothetical protein
MTVSDLQSVGLLATLCGFLGGMAAWFLLGALAAGFALLRDWYSDREYRAFVRSQAALSRSRERGRAGPAALLAVVLLAVLAAACSPAPILHTDDHAIWLERVKRSGF